MSNSSLSIFIKKDLNNYMILVFLLLAFLSGGTIIFSIQKLGGSFRVDNIYAMYAYLSRIFIMFFPVILWGSEFSNRTINLIRISKRDFKSIYLIKHFIYLITVFIFASGAFIEVFIYGLTFGIDIDSIILFRNIMTAYMLYGFFSYGLASLVCMLLRDTTKGLIVVFLINFLSSIVCNLLSQMGETIQKILNVIPFSYAESAFSFANFTISQSIYILIAGFILNIVGCMLLEKRGAV